MNALLVDIGNTRIKWASLTDEGLGRTKVQTHADLGPRDFDRIAGSARGADRILVSSVASSKVNDALVLAARRTEAPVPELVATQRRACGITVAYVEPWRMGVDRFLAMIGAHESFSRPVCVVGVGTAMTIDLLGADGRHRGGAIIPAPPLMVSSLLEATSGIRRRARGGADGRGPALFGRSTRAAVEQGARFAAAATVDRAVGEARALLGRTPRVVLTGGGARGLMPLIRASSIVVPDLVLQGLAVWAKRG